MRERRRVVVRMGEVDSRCLTRQEPMESTDMNVIVAKARRNIAPTWFDRRQPVYGDVSEVPKDLLGAYEVIERAEQAFMSLPAEVRTLMDNSPLNLEKWISDEANRPLAEKHGLLLKKKKKWVGDLPPSLDLYDRLSAEYEFDQPFSPPEPKAKGKGSDA